MVEFWTCGPMFAEKSRRVYGMMYCCESLPACPGHGVRKGQARVCLLPLFRLLQQRRKRSSAGELRSASRSSAGCLRRLYAFQTTMCNSIQACLCVMPPDVGVGRRWRVSGLDP